MAVLGFRASHQPVRSLLSLSSVPWHQVCTQSLYVAHRPCPHLQASSSVHRRHSETLAEPSVGVRGLASLSPACDRWFLSSSVCNIGLTLSFTLSSLPNLGRTCALHHRSSGVAVLGLPTLSPAGDQWPLPFASRSVDNIGPLLSSISPCSWSLFAPPHII